VPFLGRAPWPEAGGFRPCLPSPSPCQSSSLRAGVPMLLDRVEREFGPDVDLAAFPLGVRELVGQRPAQ